MKLLTVKELQARIAEVEGAKASAALKAQHAEDEEKRALLERLTKPSGLSDDEVMEKASIIINRAVENGQMSVQVFRFPHSLCSDNGRAINQAEAGWEATLTGIPREIYDFWKRQLQPRGYHIRYETINYPGGMPGDVGIILSWG
ncbi:hypothetical protein [Reyranella soli]|jgi:hypothetical protein|uniref:Uncharacterized protein n=1 Tax=Reyranella soli TaxID=1230389 RepID=A0A512N575_9HYPH|nr:hypothetical protein [Reyranella soli]GEP54126.1 hypothetical protein RSO01_12920 [Reyranella soli]